MAAAGCRAGVGGGLVRGAGRSSGSRTVRRSGGCGRCGSGGRRSSPRSSCRRSSVRTPAASGCTRRCSTPPCTPSSWARCPPPGSAAAPLHLGRGAGLHATGATHGRVRLAPAGTGRRHAHGGGRRGRSGGLRRVPDPAAGLRRPVRHRGRSPRTADLLHRVEWTGAVPAGRPRRHLGLLGADVSDWAASRRHPRRCSRIWPGCWRRCRGSPDVVVAGVDFGRRAGRARPVGSGVGAGVAGG